MTRVAQLAGLCGVDCCCQYVNTYAKALQAVSSTYAVNTMNTGTDLHGQTHSVLITLLILLYMCS